MAAADFSEIIIAQRRDNESIRRINDEFISIARSLFGERSLIRLGKLAPILSSFSYLACTNAFNLQTLGEEYVGLVQIDSTRRRLPSLWQRIAYIIIDGFMDSAEHLFSNVLRGHSSKFFDTLRLLNFYQLEGIFYLFGSGSYKLGKTLANVSYLNTRPQQNFFPSSFRILIGVSALIQFFTILLLNIRDKKENSSSNAQRIKRKRECKICASKVQHVSLNCGHLLCVDCLSDFIENESKMVKCPYCRKKYEFSRTIPLLNF